MKMCQLHWEMLKSSVEKYGLGHFIANDGKEATEHLTRELEGENTVVDFEPLLGSHNQLLSIAIQFTGGQVMALDDEGNHKCPVCELKKYNWAEGMAWQARIEAERRGLVPVDHSDIDPSVLNLRTEDPIHPGALRQLYDLVVEDEQGHGFTGWKRGQNGLRQAEIALGLPPREEVYGHTGGG